MVDELAYAEHNEHGPGGPADRGHPPVDRGAWPWTAIVGAAHVVVHGVVILGWPRALGPPDAEIRFNDAGLARSYGLICANLLRPWSGLNRDEQRSSSDSLQARPSMGPWPHVGVPRR